MKNMMGYEDFNIMKIETGTGYSLVINIMPFKLYFERNYDIDDNRMQFGIGMFNYRLGLAFEKCD